MELRIHSESIAYRFVNSNMWAALSHLPSNYKFSPSMRMYEYDTAPAE